MNISNEAVGTRHVTHDSVAARHEDGLEIPQPAGSQAEAQDHNRDTTSGTEIQIDHDCHTGHRAHSKAAVPWPRLFKPKSPDLQDARISANVGSETISPYDDDSLRAQVKNVLNMVEESNHVPNNQKSLLDILRDCIPPESPLAYSIRQLSGHEGESRSALISDGYATYFGITAPEQLLSEIVGSKKSEKRVLLIRNVENRWCEALCSRFPESVDRVFLLEHIFGFALPLFVENYYIIPPEIMTSKQTGESTVTTMRSYRSFDDVAQDRLARDKKKTYGFHVNCWYTSKSRISSSSRSIQRFKIRKTGESWNKTNGFVSCCRLTDNFYLALTTDTLFESTITPSSELLCIAPNCGSRMTVVMPNQERDITLEQLEKAVILAHQDWPIFASKCAAESMNAGRRESEVSGVIFTSLLVSRILRSKVEKEEMRMRELANSVNAEDDAQRFERLTNFRRTLGHVYHVLGNVRNAFKAHPLGFDMDCCSKSLVADAADVDGTAISTLVDFTRAYSESLLALQKRLDAIREDLNEEIQVVIGAVQVRDAQEMKKQTRETVRLANVTVALAILAAIYLPMTLVTGIFGMNVTEISKTEAAPRAWWVVVIWLVVVALTVVGGSLIWRANVKEPDIESGTSNRTVSGDQASKSRNKWRNFRKEAANFWRPKTE